MDHGEVADSIIESCPIYEDQGELCQGYLEGALCNRSCRYLREATEEILEPAKERINVFEGYEFDTE